MKKGAGLCLIERLSAYITSEPGDESRNHLFNIVGQLASRPTHCTQGSSQFCKQLAGHMRTCGLKF